MGEKKEESSPGGCTKSEGCSPEQPAGTTRPAQPNISSLVTSTEGTDAA